MKRYLRTLVFAFSLLLVFASGSMAQNGNGNGNNNAATPIGYAVGQALPWGTMPMSLTVKILKPATDQVFCPTQGLNLGQVIQCYKNAEATITYLGENRFRVALGGGISIIVLGDSL